MGLIKRLNLVLVEHDNAMRDKERLQARLGDLAADADLLHRKLDQQSALKGVVSKNLQEDLRYEREMADKLKQEIQTLRYEAERLRARLADGDLNQKQIQGDANSLTLQLRRTNDDLSALDHENATTLARRSALQDDLDAARRRLLYKEDEAIALRRQMEDVSAQRDAMVRKLKDMTRDYEGFFENSQLAKDRQARDSRVHMLGQCARKLHQTLSAAFSAAASRGLQAIAQRAEENEAGVSKLKRLARVLTKYGSHAKRLYLHKWQTTALPWRKALAQKENMVGLLSASSLRRAYFSHWREAFRRSVVVAGRQIDSIRRLQDALDKGGRMQMRSAFMLWAGREAAGSVQADLLKYACRNQYMKALRCAFKRWTRWNKEITQQVRLTTLSRNWAAWRAKQGVFLAWRESLAKQAREREEAVFRTWNSLTSAADHDHYMARAAAMSANLHRAYDRSLLKKYWDAMRKHARHQQYLGVADILNNTERPAVAALKDEIEEHQALDQKKQLTAVFRTLAKSFSNQLYSYFFTWRLETDHYKDMMVRLKLQVLRCYKGLLFSALTRWKRKNDHSKVADMTMAVEMSADDALQKQRTVFSVQHELEDDDERQQAVRRGKAAGLLRKFGQRIISHRFALWRFNVRRGQALGDATVKLCGKIRKRVLRDAMARYKGKVAAVVREERLRAKLGGRLHAQDSRLKESVMRAWQRFHEIWQRGRKYLRRSMLKTQTRLLERGMGSWKAAMVKLSETMMRAQQDRLQAEIDRLNAEQEQVNASILDVTRRGGALNQSMERMGQRSLLKYLNLLCSRQISERFYYWRHLTEQAGKQEALMRKYLTKMMNFFTLGAFEKWKDVSHAERRQENARRKKELENQLRHIKELAEREARRNEEELAQLDKTMHQVAAEGQKHAEQYKRAVGIVTRRAAENDYIDRRRLVWDQWRHAMREEKARMKQMCQLATKALRRRFFRGVVDTGRRGREADRRAKVMKRAFYRLGQNAKRDAFSLWRADNTTMMVVQLDEATSNLQKEQVASRQFQAQQQERAAVRFGRVKNFKAKRAVFQQLKGTCAFLRSLKQRKRELATRLIHMRKGGALGKLGALAEDSREQRWRKNKAILHLQNRSLFKVFHAWMDQFIRERTLPRALQKLFSRGKLTDRALAFDTIKDFHLARDNSARVAKSAAAKYLFGGVERGLQRQRKQALALIRHRGLDWSDQVALQRGMILRGMRRRLRRPFDIWRLKSEQVGIVRAVNRDSEVASDAYGARNKVVNIKRMLVQEGYDPEEIDREVEQRRRGVEKTMEQAVKKLKLRSNPDLACLPRALEAWKDYVSLRKNVKFYADFIHKHLGPNLFQSAFLKWKQYRVSQQLPLERLPKVELARRCMDNERNVGVQKIFMDDQDDYLDDLQSQKLALLNRCLASRKMALTVPREQMDGTKELAFHRWKHAVHDMEVMYLTTHVKQQTALLEKMKERYTSLEGENNALIEDNEQLRQASMDGIEIAKAVQELTKQREQLSVDLVDRASSLKKLMQDNEKLRAAIAYKKQEVSQIMTVLTQPRYQQQQGPPGCGYLRQEVENY